MEIKLQDLRRYAIEERAEIDIISSTTGRRLQLTSTGQVRVPEEYRSKDIKIEDVFEAADVFELRASGKTRRLTVAEMAQAVGDLFKSRGVAAAAPKEED